MDLQVRAHGGASSGFQALPRHFACRAETGQGSLIGYFFIRTRNNLRLRHYFSILQELPAKQLPEESLLTVMKWFGQAIDLVHKSPRCPGGGKLSCISDYNKSRGQGRKITLPTETKSALCPKVARLEGCWDHACPHSFHDGIQGVMRCLK